VHKAQANRAAKLIFIYYIHHLFPAPQVLYSDIDQGLKPGVGVAGGDWFLGDTGGVQRPGEPDRLYQYPTDGEMHTAPTDTRYVLDHWF